MALDLNRAANDFFSSPEGAKLSEKKDDLNKLMNSPEGQNVKNMLTINEAGLVTALEKGDTAVLKKALSDILKTEDGARIAEQILNMMK